MLVIKIYFTFDLSKQNTMSTNNTNTADKFNYPSVEQMLALYGHLMNSFAFNIGAGMNNQKEAKRAALIVADEAKDRGVSMSDLFENNQGACTAMGITKEDLDV